MTPSDVYEYAVGRETILVVDDERIIIEVTSEMLTEIGYNVLTARSGEEALAVYGENQGRIDLVILDMIMPGMGGGATFDRLKAVNPDIKVILSSGYSINGQAGEIMARGGKAFLQKPYRLVDLSRKIREVLKNS
ncbi:MAG TPA: response regulator [Syntrophales bacterium]|nr:response regulator [Syntrophales bacterium]